MVYMSLATCLCLALLPLSLYATGPLQHFGVGQLQGFALTIACHVPVAWMTQAHMQYLHIGAMTVFGIMQQYDFCCILGNWENLEIIRLTDNLCKARDLCFLSLLCMIHGSLGSSNQLLNPNNKLGVSLTLNPCANHNVNGVYQLLPKNTLS